MVGFVFLCFLIGKETCTTQKIKFKTEISHALVTCIFPRFQLFGCFYFEFSLATCDIFLRSDWP